MVSKFRGNYRICRSQYKSNVRELEGAIISLIAQSSFNKRVTLELAKSVVEKFVKNVKEKFQSITFKKLFQTIFNWI
jgi:chromosomal replication initiator protein